MAMKKCPFCAEEIQAEAVFCRYCQSNLTGGFSAPPSFQSAPGAQYQPVGQPVPPPMGYQPMMQPQPVGPAKIPLFLPPPAPGDNRVAVLFDQKGEKFNTHGVTSVNQMINVVQHLSLEQALKRVKSTFPETPVLREKVLPRVAGMMKPDEQVLFFAPRYTIGKPENDAFMLTDRAFYSLRKKDVLVVDIMDIKSITKLITVNSWYINENTDIGFGGTMQDESVGDILAVISLICGLYHGTFNGSGFKVLLQGWDYDA